MNIFIGILVASGFLILGVVVFAFLLKKEDEHEH